MSLTDIIKQATNNFSLKKLSRGISAHSIGYTAALFLAAAAPNFSCNTDKDGRGQSSYGCTMDNDCKGDRVCVEGDCVSPSETGRRDAGRQYEDVGNIVDRDAGNAVEDNEPPQDTGGQYEDAGGGEDAGRPPVEDTNPGRGSGSYCEPCSIDTDCQEGMVCYAPESNPDVKVCSPERVCHQDANCGGEYVCDLEQRKCTPGTAYGCRDNILWLRDGCGNWLAIEEECTRGNGMFPQLCGEDYGACIECFPMDDRNWQPIEYCHNCQECENYKCVDVCGEGEGEW